MKISVVIATLGRETLEQCVKSLKDADEIVLVGGSDIKCVDAYNEGYANTTGDFILHTNDRSIFDKGWREKTEEALKKINNYGVVSYNTNIVLAGCVSRDYIEKEQLGYLYWPEYIHYHPDMEMGELARMNSHYVESLGFIHYHDKKDMNLEGEKQVSDESVIWDKNTYQLRQRLGFPREFVTNMKERDRIAYGN